MLIILTHEGTLSDSIRFLRGEGKHDTFRLVKQAVKNDIEHWAKFESAWLDGEDVVVRHTSWDGTFTDTLWEDSAPRKCRLDEILGIVQRKSG